VIANPAAAIARFDELAALFEQARLHESSDGAALSELLDEAALALRDLVPAIVAFSGDPLYPDIVAAARRVRPSLDLLTRAIRVEANRISGELTRLSEGEIATAQYHQESFRGQRRALDLSA